ncbi:MAG: membrane protein insertase YidC [Lysobacterales bacterium]|jgi:YidC/Oxa1 family membrane protein insertase|nr:MAG: membrane protein insertase YidC [Xanthomonadales bacterium]
MNPLRTLLFLAWLFTLFLLWQNWVLFEARRAPATPVPADSPEESAAERPSVPGDLPLIDVERGQLQASPPPAEALVEVESDLLRLRFSPRGASLVGAELLAYPIDPRRPEPVVELLGESPTLFHVAQSGWIGPDGVLPDHLARFTALDGPRRLEGERLDLRFVWEDPDHHLRLERTWRIHRGSYVLELIDRWTHSGETARRLHPYHQLLRSPPPRPSAFSFTNPELYSFVGAAWWSPEARFEKLAFEDFARSPIASPRSVERGWIAMLQHYFVAAWIPSTEHPFQLQTAVSEPGRFLIRAIGPGILLEPGASHESRARLYVGPKLQKLLPEVAEGLDLTVDYGIFTIFAKPLFWLLEFFHRLLGNWGLAIIALTVLIKLAFYKLSEAQYRSMAKLRKLQPRLEALKERYGDDRQKLNQAMLELYRKEKINPLGGCLPILIQIPVFIALYWVLLESVELRQAPFFGWIRDLSAKDPYYVLPVLNGIAMWLTQRLSPSPGMDPLQQRVMQTLPILFAVLFAFFPSGLVLYWTVNGVLGLAQQWYILRKFEGSARRA